MLTRFIGDVHGDRQSKYQTYKRLIAGVARSRQVGDMGLGFFYDHTHRRYQEAQSNPPHYAMVRGDHKFIRGNHDNPDVCRRHSQWIPDGTVEGDVMYVGGALSVDRGGRTEGYNWWADEELSIAELYAMTDKYLEIRPRVMVTHDCPEDVGVIINAASGRDKIRYPSRTRQAFQSMWSAHSPQLWVFGHWHHSFDHVFNGTRFICLAELEYRDIDI